MDEKFKSNTNSRKAFSFFEPFWVHLSLKLQKSDHTVRSKEYLLGEKNLSSKRKKLKVTLISNLLKKIAKRSQNSFMIDEKSEKSPLFHQ